MFKSHCLFAQRSSIAWLASLDKETNNVTIKGWVTSVQRFGRMLFVKLTDRRCSAEIQAVVPRKFFAERLNVGSAMSLSGDWVPSCGNQQSMELLAERCDYVGYNEQPLLPTETNVLRQHLHFRSRDPAFAAILRLRSQLTMLSHRFFNTVKCQMQIAHDLKLSGRKSDVFKEERDFTFVDTPLLSHNDCEGASEVFNVESKTHPHYFGETEGDVYLSVSTQLHLEAICSGLSNVYTIGPAFRADPSSTRQHLAEFRMLEAEFAFVEHVEEVCDLVEDYLSFIAAHVRLFTDDLRLSESLCRRSGHLLDYFVASEKHRIPRITYAVAVDALRAGGAVVSPGGNLSKADELLLVQQFDGPVFVTHFPAAIKPFYMKRTEDGAKALNFDLLAPFVGELAGGSVRADHLAADVPSLDWYVQLRRAGYSRSAGFGLGVERLMQSMFGIENVKDTVAFPRWYKHCRH